MVSIKIRNFGPIEDAVVNVYPLTVFIGRNSVGKSMLLYLLWVLDSTDPDFRYWLRESSVNEDIDKLYSMIITGSAKAIDVSEDIYNTLYKLLDTFPKAWSKSLEKAFRESFGVEPRNLVRIGQSSSKIVIENSGLAIELTIEGNRVNSRWANGLEGLSRDLESLKAVIEGKYLTITHKVFGELTHYITKPMDILVALIGNAIPFILEEYLGFTPGLRETSLLVDGRAGIIRMLYHPDILYSIRNVLKTDSSFITLLSSLAASYTRGEIDRGCPLLTRLLTELGVKPVVREEFGLHRIYVETWSKALIPLEQSPSGIREVIPLVLALLRSRDGVENIYIEEPETHLHPSAIRLIARLIVYSVNKLGKRVFVSTHSDHFIYQLGNLVLLSNKKDQARELGFTEHEVLEPSSLGLYLVYRQGDHAEVEKLEVTKDGIDEEIFERISRELLEERSIIMGQKL